MKWNPPLTREGKPCKRCRQGRLCPMHRAGNKKHRKRGPRHKLTPELIDQLREANPGHMNHVDLATACNISSGTWFRWLDEGETHEAEGKWTRQRELYDIVKESRRIAASKLRNAAFESAIGHYAVQTNPKTGKPMRVYKTAPEGRLAMQLASRLDPREIPPEKQVHEHEGTANIIVETWQPTKKDLKELDAASKARSD